MTTQQENYINSKLEAYRGYLETEDERWIEGEVLKELEKKEEKERERLDGMIATERIALSGREYEAHMKKFSKDAKKELYGHFKAIYDAENEKFLEGYRRELEKEAVGGEENWY